MLHSDAKSWPPGKYLRKYHRRVLEFRQWLARDIRITDGQADYRFRCETAREFNRCLKLFSKEPGTFEWITAYVQPGEVFYDIGANIGVYTILAASRVGNTGRVYAFEPHGANFARLVDNISVNNLQAVVVPVNFALNDTEGFFSFNYSSSKAGTSDSQLAAGRDSAGATSPAGITELKYATTIDRLIAAGKIKAPHHVKIDVDGNEPLILQGMSQLLRSDSRPKTIQVEMNDPHKDTLRKFMDDHHYRLSHQHFTRSSQRKIDAGTESQTLNYNAIFHYEK